MNDNDAFKTANDIYSKYKKILNKYVKEDEIGVWVSGFLILNYIHEYGDDIDMFEKYIKEYVKFKEKIKRLKKTKENKI